jgi:outer membrane receptor for ferric coprogen and ferric-rhodotorulic acid
MQDNTAEGRGYGAELSTTWQLRPWWQLRAAWWGIQQQVRDAHSPEGNESTTPHHFWLLASRLDLPGNLELDTAVYFQGRREFEGNPFQPTTKLGSHHRVDVRLGWHASERLELSLVALDLFDRQDQEFAPIASPQVASQTQRSVYGQLRWAF